LAQDCWLSCQQMMQPHLPPEIRLLPLTWYHIPSKLRVRLLKLK
jgi:hypothetical protein